MSSFFYSTKSTGKALYPIPDTLEPDYVVAILHNEAVLSHVLWPPSSQAQGENRILSNLSNLTMGLKNPQFKDSLSPVANGVICTEEMPAGLTMTITYTVAGREAAEKQSTHRMPKPNAASAPADSKVYLEEERTIRAPKPLSSLMSFSNGPSEKTQNILRFLEELSRNGWDVVSALGSYPAFDVPEEKSKRE